MILSGRLHPRIYCNTQLVERMKKRFSNHIGSKRRKKKEEEDEEEEGGTHVLLLTAKA